MPKIKPRELREMSIESIEEKLLDLKRELSKINAKLSSGTVPENPGGIREVKKTIARMLTIITEKKKQPEKKELPKEHKPAAEKQPEKKELPKEHKPAAEKQPEKKELPKEHKPAAEKQPKKELKQKKPAAKKEEAAEEPKEEAK
ncbi:MAG: 50S ribosomal protein L29 [Candidatus Woesearchaeota archaeon]